MDGVLMAQRGFLYFSGPDPLYSDAWYGYDDWGNRTSLTVDTQAYPGSTPPPHPTSPTLQTTSTCFGSFNRSTGACTPDAYHTYASGTENMLDHREQITWDYVLGVPLSFVDANGDTTSAEYDDFSRITDIVRPYDSFNEPTVTVSYHPPTTPGDPFYTEVRQRIQDSDYFIIRKYYGGLGTLLETQVLNADLEGDIQRDVVVTQRQGYAVVNSVLRAVQEQSVPYALSPGSGFQGWDAVISGGVAYSRSVLDEQGRPLYAIAPDGSQTSYTYNDGYEGANPYTQAAVTDAESHTTLTRMDIWGRTVRVTPPTGPQVNYTYNAADRLTGVTYGAVTTSLVYDHAGRKTQMVDPDMGTWYYSYDALGNLVRQTDARGQRTCLYYDSLNRLLGKHYRTDDACPSSPATYDVSYTYDYGANGLGRRTGMTDGSYSVAWSYDQRGRLTQESRIVDGITFQTNWTFNSADLVTSLTYPGTEAREQVSFSYHRQMLLDRVYTSGLEYVHDTDYDTAGRIVQRNLGGQYGGAAVLRMDYSYYPWTQQGGRLQTLQSGLSGTPGSLQNLSYQYDLVGNVTSISDRIAVAPLIQTQSFGYDYLDRLTSAQAYNYSPTGEPGSSGVTSSDGTYSMQNYVYNNSTGNMESNAGMSYTYDYPTRAEASAFPAHGVRRVTGGTTATGQVLIRARGTYASNAWPVMRLYVNGVYIKQWTVSSVNYANYTVTTGVTANAQIDVVFTNAVTGRTLRVDYVTLPVAGGSRTVQAESSGTIFDRGQLSASIGSNAFDGINAINGAELMAENGALRFVVGPEAFAGGYDLNGNLILRMLDGVRYYLTYNAENRMTGVSGTASATFVYDGDGVRIKSIINTAVTIYIGSYFEYRGGWGSTVNYYYAGGQRVAMRSSGAVEYLLGDHLGSTSLTVDYAGGNPRELRYYPWGEVRYFSGTTPTDYRFTGQMEVASIGLYFYNARWYDAALARFVQADSIVPNPGDPISFDRYTYSRNSPVRFVDPTGHNYCDSENSLAEDCEGITELLPDAACRADDDCYDAYLAYYWLVILLGRTPSDSEILQMTVLTEYWAYTTSNSNVAVVGQEALARNYYDRCSTDGCQGSEIYRFLAGYAPWMGDATGIDGTARGRAEHLLTIWNGGANSAVTAHAETITSLPDNHPWTAGFDLNRPWQWYGPFDWDPAIEPDLGYSPDDDAILAVDLGNNHGFWMFTGAQDRSFDPDAWGPREARPQ